MTPLRGDMASRVAAELARRRPSQLGTTSREPSTLVLGDPAPHLALALEDSGHAVTRWHRFVTPGQLCTPWPPSGTFGEAWVRMPRSSLEAAMLVHSGAARVPDGARLHLFGANDEGIRSAARHFPTGTGTPRAALIKRHCRVLVAERLAPPPRPDGLHSWKHETQVDWGAGERDWRFYPGVFAHGRLDPATALLIGHLPRLPAGARVLDFGAGTGPVAAAALERGAHGIEVLLLEPDAISLAAAKRNVPSATPILGQGISSVSGPFHLIVSNPPIHAGKAQSLHTVEALVRDAPAVLARRGQLLLVAQRRLPVGPLLERSFGNVRAIVTRGDFRVWSGGAGNPRAANARRGRSVRPTS